MDINLIPVIHRDRLISQKVRMVCLVYQCGIANLFDASADANLERIYQGDYRTCENIARGILFSGGTVLVYHCEMAGECKLFDWNPGKGTLWEDKRNPPEGSRDADNICYA
jgi:hypothetical protein